MGLFPLTRVEGVKGEEGRSPPSPFHDSILCSRIPQKVSYSLGFDKASHNCKMRNTSSTHLGLHVGNYNSLDKYPHILHSATTSLRRHYQGLAPSRPC